MVHPIDPLEYLSEAMDRLERHSAKGSTRQRLFLEVYSVLARLLAEGRQPQQEDTRRLRRLG
jgi:hypothetical protein